MNRPGGDGGEEDTKEDGEDADYITDPNHLDNDDIYHLPQYQSASRPVTELGTD